MNAPRLHLFHSPQRRVVPWLIPSSIACLTCAVSATAYASVPKGHEIPKARPTTAGNRWSLRKPVPQIRLALGPTLEAIDFEGAWDSQLGAEMYLVRLMPARTLAAIGVAMGVSSFAKSDATRLSLEIYAGIGLSDDFTIGLSLAPLIDLYPSRLHSSGLRASLWLHAGVAPYIALSRVWGQDTRGSIDLSIGLRIPFSIWQF